MVFSLFFSRFDVMYRWDVCRMKDHSQKYVEYTEHPQCIFYLILSHFAYAMANIVNYGYAAVFHILHNKMYGSVWFYTTITNKYRCSQRHRIQIQLWLSTHIERYRRRRLRRCVYIRNKGTVFIFASSFMDAKINRFGKKREEMRTTDRKKESFGRNRRMAMRTTIENQTENHNKIYVGKSQKVK